MFEQIGQSVIKNKNRIIQADYPDNTLWAIAYHEHILKKIQLEQQN